MAVAGSTAAPTSSRRPDYPVSNSSVVDIRAKVLTALRWTVTARFFGQVLSWAITIVVIRMLSPEDYGLMAMAMVLISFSILINTAGLDAVLVQQRDLQEQGRRQIFGVIIVVNAALFALMVIGASWIADFYREPRLTAVIQVLAFHFVILIFETLPQSQLERDINFKQRSVVELITMFAGSVVTLIFAYADMGVWALVWGALAGTASRVIGFNLIERSLVWPSFSVKGMMSQLAFGGSVTLDRGLRFIFAESDKFIGGRVLGKELLGYYAVASHLASLPIQKLQALINSVAFPAFSRVQSDPLQVGRYLLKASRVLSILAFPVFFGISSIAPELTSLLLGEKWQVAALPLQILSVIMPVRMLMNLFQPLLWGIGRPDVSATNFLLAAIVMPIAFTIGVQWGAVGLALAWSCAFPIVFFVSVWRAVAQVNLRLSDFLMTMARPVFASALMYAAVIAAKTYAVRDSGELLYVTQLVLVGALAYVALLVAMNRQGLLEALRLLRH
jgi:O-antigen/teichoic acid export membrane protein